MSISFLYLSLEDGHNVGPFVSRAESLNGGICAAGLHDLVGGLFVGNSGVGVVDVVGFHDVNLLSRCRALGPPGWALVLVDVDMERED